MVQNQKQGEFAATLYVNGEAQEFIVNLDNGTIRPQEQELTREQLTRIASRGCGVNPQAQPF